MSPATRSQVTDSKIKTLAEAAALVHDGEHLALSGFSIARNAVALARELVRQGRRDLVLSQCILGLDTELLVGAGCVRHLVYGGGSLDRFGQLERVNRAVEQGRVTAEYTSSLSVCFRYLAGALGLPFMPIKSLLGSDLLKPVPVGAALAPPAAPPDAPLMATPDYLREIDCPFTGEPLALLRALTPDVAIIQVQQADEEGNARILGPLWDNNEAAKAASQVIVITEEIVPDELIRQQPELTTIPAFRVSAVVPLRYGAHPTSLYRYYDYDADHLKMYAARNKSQSGFDEYLHEYVLGLESHDEYIELVGGEARLATLKADPTLGY